MVDIARRTRGTTNNAAQDVMDIGNPDLLKLWCDPIHALVITLKSSEGAQNAANRGKSQQQHQHQRQTRDREYEGEWIEATTPALRHPRQAREWYVCFYLDFPHTGKSPGVCGTRSCGPQRWVQVALKYPIISKILSEEDGGKSRIVDDVKLRRLGSDENDESHFCGVINILGEVLSPRFE
jgi:hypothetical protein